MKKALAALRWEAEQRRAAERGLLTTAQAATKMGVPTHMVKHWKSLGLINDFGGGKGYPSLFDPEELITAPARRQNLRVGWRGRAMTEAERQAQKRMNAGIHVTLPLDSPFRMLAFSCRTCGDLVTCKNPRKSVPRSYYAHDCYMEKAREQGRRPGVRARTWAHARRTNAATLDAASRNGHHWTGPELEVAARTDLTARQVATMLGRTMFAVRTQRQKLRNDPKTIRLAGLSSAEG